jgi:hypothetical protein
MKFVIVNGKLAVENGTYTGCCGASVTQKCSLIYTAIFPAGYEQFERSPKQ